MAGATRLAEGFCIHQPTTGATRPTRRTGLVFRWGNTDSERRELLDLERPANKRRNHKRKKSVREATMADQEMIDRANDAIERLFALDEDKPADQQAA